MKSFKSLLFFLPIVLILAVDTQGQDVGLWFRLTAVSALGLVGMWQYRRTLPKQFTVSMFLVALLMLVVVQLGSVPAKSEVYAFIARIAMLFGWFLIGRAALDKDKEGALQSLAFGSQIALLTASLSLLPGLMEAYEKGNMYLANGPLFTHKNYAAATLLLFIPIAMMRKEEGAVGMWIQRISVALALIEIVLLRTRGVWLGAFAMAAVASVHYIVVGNAKWRNQSLIALALVVSGIGAAIVLGGSEKIFNSDTIQTRMHYWQASWEMFLEHPVSGVGAGQWKVEYPGTGLRGTNESVMNGSTTILRPHNDVLWMLSELGIFGALAFVALLFLGFMGNVKGGQNLYMALVVVGFAVYGLGEFPVERTTMLIPLALALATASASQKSIFNLPYSAPLLVLCLSFSFGVGTQRVHGEREAKGALQGYLNRNAKDMLSYSVSAENAFFEMDIYNNPMAYFEAIGFLTTGGQQPSQGLVNKAKSGFERALSVHPNHMLSMNQLANIHRMQGDLEQAAELYYKVLEMSPRNTTAALRLVELERSKGDLYASLNALKMLSTQHTPQNLNGLGQEATKTLMAFSRLENVRPALASLHEQLKGAPAGKMWSIWSKWREK